MPKQKSCTFAYFLLVPASFKFEFEILDSAAELDPNSGGIAPFFFTHKGTSSLWISKTKGAVNITYCYKNKTLNPKP